jgi:hypothetical protein
MRPVGGFVFASTGAAKERTPIVVPTLRVDDRRVFITT